MPIAPGQRIQIARLFHFVMLCELIARDCARRQAALSSDSGSRRFLQAEARQEAFHVQVFRSAIGGLAPQILDAAPSVPQLARYRALTERALDGRDFTETLIAQQVILEGLGDVVFERIGSGMTDRGVGFTRLRRMLTKQEHAQHAFGLRTLNQAIATERTSVDSLRQQGTRYLELVEGILVRLSETFETFAEDPGLFRRHFQQTLTTWLRADCVAQPGPGCHYLDLPSVTTAPSGPSLLCGRAMTWQCRANPNVTKQQGISTPTEY